MENNAESLLNSILGLKIFNTKPHLFEPSYFFEQFLQVMNKYVIGKNEIQTMKMRQMYYWIVEKRKVKFYPVHKFSYFCNMKQIHNGIFPN